MEAAARNHARVYRAQDIARRKFLCDTCIPNAVFGDLHSLKRHLKTPDHQKAVAKKQAAEQQVKLPALIGKYVCNTCYKTFASQWGWSSYWKTKGYKLPTDPRAPGASRFIDS
jgi:hypothetical protein